MTVLLFLKGAPFLLTYIVCSVVAIYAIWCYNNIGMLWIKRNTIIACIIIAALLLSACEKQEAYLLYSPLGTSSPNEIVVTSPKPTATPIRPSTVTVYGTPFNLDNRGIAIIDPSTHYFLYYISFSDIRIYEEDEHSYLDAICTNGYDLPLKGKCTIVFYDQEGRICGNGLLHSADSVSFLNLPTGDTRVYSEIASETDISTCTFEINIDYPFLPNG